MAARRGRGHNAFIMNKSTYPHPLRSRIRAGELVLGSVLSAPYASVAAQTCGTGIDFLWIDTEHQPYGAEAMDLIPGLARMRGVAPMIRVAWNDPHLIKKAYDSGAVAVMVPQISNAEEAARAVQYARYPPLGKRGMTGGRITGFGRLPLPEYIDLANRQTPIIPMIESRAGVDALGDILQLDGVGMIMEGALDLALDLGLGPDPLNPRVWQTLQGMADACLGAGVAFCANPRTVEQNALWRARGVRSFLAGEDRGLLHNALKARLHSLQQQ